MQQQKRKKANKKQIQQIAKEKKINHKKNKEKNQETLAMTMVLMG